jgi:thiol-disulfide isomerase/thioredoxin
MAFVGLSYMLFKFIHMLVDKWQGQLAPFTFFSYLNYQLAFFKRTRLSSLRGKLVCLDFWFTWCPYCQETMEKLDRTSAQNHNHWNDRVTVVPISLDEDSAAVSRHLKKRGWTHLEHYWAGPWTSYPLDAPAAQALGLDFAPKAFLIGADGRILWIGHPLAQVSGKDITDRIDELLKRDSQTERAATPSASATVPQSACQTPARGAERFLGKAEH